MRKLIINEEEKSRILSLHTNAIKNYLNEQDASASPQPLVIQLAGTFESGQADIKNMAPIEDAKKQVSNFLSKLPQNQRIGITIKAGESQVPNQAPYEEIGSLAKARANELKTKLTSVLSDFGDKVVVNPNVETKVGDTKWNPSLGKDNEVYRKEQYANAVVQAIGGVPAKPTKPEPTCEKYQFYFGNHVLTTYSKAEAVKFLNKLAGKDQNPTLKPNCMNLVGTAYRQKAPSLPNDYSTYFKETIGWTNGEGKMWKSEEDYRSNSNVFWFNYAQLFPGITPNR